MARRALVLGGGGLTAISWEVGVLEGLAEVGVALDRFDLVVGTSAGAFVGARLLGEGSAAPLFEAQLAADSSATAAELAVVCGGLAMRIIRLARQRRFSGLARTGVIPLALRAAFVNAAMNGIGEFAKVRSVARWRRSGSAPTSADLAALGSVARGVRRPESTWVDFWVRALRPVDDWPGTSLSVIAVDISSGTRRAVNRDAGVPLERALAASTSLPGLLPPITIGDRRYMDGGVGSPTNADLAAGYEEVLIVAPVDRGALAGELAVLKTAGSTVRVIRPGLEALAAMGEELARLDPVRRAGAGRAGRDDGLAAGRQFRSDAVDRTAATADSSSVRIAGDSVRRHDPGSGRTGRGHRTADDRDRLSGDKLLSSQAPKDEA